jgi:tRNA1(Val) A37 N6-methylase TrmN6
MVGLSGIGEGEIALEPSAGQGRIVRRLMARRAMVDAVDIDPENCKVLRAIPDIRCVSEQDFLEYAKVDAAQYDAVVMNPPFANNQDIKHIYAA